MANSRYLKGGLSNGSYTRLVATASTTDSGIEVVGVYSIMKDDKSGGDTDVLGISTNQNDLSLSGGFGTFLHGNTKIQQWYDALEHQLYSGE